VDLPGPGGRHAAPADTRCCTRPPVGPPSRRLPTWTPTPPARCWPRPAALPPRCWRRPTPGDNRAAPGLPKASPRRRAFRAAYQRLRRRWLAGAGLRPEAGGQGLPQVLNAALYEMLAAANHGWTMYPGLLHGAYEVHAAPRHARALQRAYLRQAGQRRVAGHDVPDRAAGRQRPRPGAHAGHCRHREPANGVPVQPCPAARSSSPAATTT
jgi:hypothetical protein